MVVQRRRGVLEKLQEPLVGPVDVVDRDHHRVLRADAREEAPPGEPERPAGDAGAIALTRRDGGERVGDLPAAIGRPRSAGTPGRPDVAGVASEPTRAAREGSPRAPRTRSRPRTEGCGRRVPRERGSPSIASSSSRASRVFPSPASPRSAPVWGCARAGSQVREAEPLELVARPRKGVAAVRPEPRSPRRGVPRSGSGKPFASIWRASPSTARRQPATARSPTRICPGSAACWSRAAAVVASPVTARSALPDSTRTSPVSTPIRS